MEAYLICGLTLAASASLTRERDVSKVYRQWGSGRQGVGKWEPPMAVDQCGQNLSLSLLDLLMAFITIFLDMVRMEKPDFEYVH
ncbi:conserved hypothetical protein [Ricinus communis]|uniref:Uncharacterized protein n=1 Tax=Ricinus communis TaxID=3988 RepID=B9SFC0_RICCO|nr:conserved hypothetical protein [Ricinus communis]